MPSLHLFTFVMFYFLAFDVAVRPVGLRRMLLSSVTTTLEFIDSLLVVVPNA